LYTTRVDILLKIVFHSNRKSIIDIIPKLIIFDFLDEKNEAFEETRKELISILVSKLDSKDFEVYYNININRNLIIQSVF